MFKISQEELYELYITQNLSAREISEKFEVSIDTIKNQISKYKIKKDRKKSIQKIKEGALTIRKKTCLEKYGYTHPLKNTEIKKISKQTCLEKYGVESPLLSKEIREKARETMVKKYGVEHPIQNNEIKGKIKKTCKEKYGTENPLLNKDIKNKQKETMKKRYGVINPFESEEIKEKSKATIKKRYGVEHVMQNEEIKNKFKQTCIDKYGVDIPLKCNKIKEKSKETCLKKYGKEIYVLTDDFKDKRTAIFIKKYGTINPFANDEVKNKIKEICLKEHGVPYFCMTEKARKNNGFTISKVNKVFLNELKKIGINAILEKNIEKYSYDIEIPTQNILIEINPTYTHNSTDGGWFNGHKKNSIPKMYHYDKSQVAINKGYRCIHIWDWDNYNKIINMLKPKEKIQARKCDIKEISDDECDAFLNKYHLQNSCKGQIVKVGLFYNNKLIEVMTFGKPRYNKKYEWELLRLCSDFDYYIVGGAGKLFSYFIKKYNPQNIISYCDNSKFNGNIYKILGFDLFDYGVPSKHWYNEKTKRHITDNLLRQRGFDQLFKTNYGKGTSNEDLIIKNGFVEIYDCGQSVYIWDKH